MKSEDVPLEVVTTDGEDPLTDPVSDYKKPRFVGLSKEELDRSAGSKKWRRIRLVLFALFWILWAALLLAAILLLVNTPKCARQIQLEWYEGSPGYSIEVRSFLDTDKNGIGDVNGIIEKLNYIKNQGYKFIIISNSVLNENEYMKLNSTLASIENIKTLQAQAKAKSLKVVIEIPFNKSHGAVKRKESAEYWCNQIRLDGILMRFQGEDEAKVFNTPLGNEVYDELERISKKTLKKKALILDTNRSGLKAHLFIRTLDFGGNGSLIEKTSKLLCSNETRRVANQLDSIYTPRVIEKEGINADYNSYLALLTTVYFAIGTPIITYGTELMINSSQNTNFEGMPIMGWEKQSQFLGFTSGDMTWINVTAKTRTVQELTAYGASISALTLITKLNELVMSHKPLSNSTSKLLNSTNNSLLLKLSSDEDYPSYLVAINLGDTAEFSSAPCSQFGKNADCKLKRIFDSSKKNMTVFDEDDLEVPIEAFMIPKSSLMVMVDPK